jgi:DNA-binding transcriptional regulator YiaG
MKKLEDAGLENVWLANGFAIKETTYGTAEIINNVPGLTRAICLALAGKSGRLSGAEFRYLRLHLRLSQKSLAQCFGTTEQAVALWEKTGRVPLWADKHIRVLWKVQEAGDETVKKVVERINLIDQLVNQKIVVEETRRGWKGRVEDEPVAA